MGNSPSHVKYHKLSYLREKQHNLFFQLQSGSIDFETFKREMIGTYNNMHLVSPGIHPYYEKLLVENIRDAEDALSRKYEFNAELPIIDPFPAGYFAGPTGDD